MGTTLKHKYDYMTGPFDSMHFLWVPDFKDFFIFDESLLLPNSEITAEDLIEAKNKLGSTDLIKLESELDNIFKRYVTSEISAKEVFDIFISGDILRGSGFVFDFVPSPFVLVGDLRNLENIGAISTVSFGAAVDKKTGSFPSTSTNPLKDQFGRSVQLPGVIKIVYPTFGKNLSWNSHQARALSHHAVLVLAEELYHGIQLMKDFQSPFVSQLFINEYKPKIDITQRLSKQLPRNWIEADVFGKMLEVFGQRQIPSYYEHQHPIREKLRVRDYYTSPIQSCNSFLGN